MALLTTEDVLNKKFQYVKFREYTTRTRLMSSSTRLSPPSTPCRWRTKI